MLPITSPCTVARGDQDQGCTSRLPVIFTGRWTRAEMALARGPRSQFHWKSRRKIRIASAIAPAMRRAQVLERAGRRGGSGGFGGQKRGSGG